MNNINNELLDALIELQEKAEESLKIAREAEQKVRGLLTNEE